MVQVGELVLVPTYRQVDATWNDRALEFYRRLAPNRKVRAVDASSIMEKALPELSSVRGSAGG